MPLIHFLLIGHFEHDVIRPEGREIVRNVRHPDGYPCPVHKKPIDLGLLDRIVREVTDGREALDDVRQGWDLVVGEDYLRLDQHTLDPRAVEVVRRFAHETGAEIWDEYSWTEINPEALIDVYPHVRPLAAPLPAAGELQAGTTAVRRRRTSHRAPAAR